jgi:endonuclease YncB( thermonuclease family)
MPRVRLDGAAAPPRGHRHGTPEGPRGAEPTARLRRPVLDVARKLAAPAHLETSSTGNVALYERSGFRVIGETVVPGGGARVWAMQT